MILSDSSIRMAIDAEHLFVTPFNDAAVQPASLDLTLGDRLLAWPMDRLRDPRYGSADQTWQEVPFRDVPDGPIWILQPHRRYLATTAEEIQLPRFLAAQIAARSSWGRDGLDVIQGPAGFIDPGYRGRPTLELSVTGSELVIWPGAPCLQIVFYRLDAECERPYGSKALGSRYQGDLDPTPARRVLR